MARAASTCWTRRGTRCSRCITRRCRGSGWSEACACLCGSGLVSRKGRAAAPGFQQRFINCWGRFAALSRHKAAPTGARQAC
ncbi:hypothetical protein DMX12_18165 [Pseudomonas sp. MB-090624]|nr:hypothetical protein DMX12_18165 [Pseudomonas sp. MB-090624]